MKVTIDTKNNTCKVGTKDFNDTNKGKQDAAVIGMRMFLHDNTMMSNYETDCMWMSYRYCIGRHTIASHGMAGDIAKNCYKRMTDERSIFTAYDINRSIEDCMRFGNGPEWRFPITSLNKIYTTAIDVFCEFLEDYDVKSKEDYLSSAGISPDGFFELSTRSYSFDGDYSGIGIYDNLSEGIIFSVDRDLNIVKKKVQDYWGYPADKTRIGEKDGSAVLRSDPLFEGFDAGTPIVYIDYGDFYLIVSTRITGPFPYQPLEISSIWYCYETVYSAYDTNGTLLFRSAVDIIPYSRYLPEDFSSAQ